MKRIDFTHLGGLHTYQDTLEFMQDSYRNSFAAIAAFLGDKHVVSGCVDNGVTCTDGWIVYDGELIPFTGGALGATVVISEVITQEGFEDTTLKDVYYTKTAGFGVGGTSFPYSELKRLPFGLTSITDFATQIDTILKGMLQFEDEVIIEGCEVTDVDTVPGELEIAAGLVLFGGVLLASEAYSGAYPAYLQEDGAWVTAVPGAGLYITFDPYTSQRYVNVLDRAITPAGRIVMMETLTDRFDGAFVGRWEMKGYSLMSAMQNRVPVGLWFDGVPVANVSNVVNQTAGNQEGERQHTLITGEMPAHTHAITASTEANFAGSGKVPGVNAGGTESGGATDSTGGGDPHNNIQPSTVVVYAKRTA